MYNIAKANPEERRILFRNAAGRIGINEAMAEKDFWVCLTLDYLFHKCKLKESFTFKGGTSLSKCYGLIHRFSEDIDLILDWRLLGYTKDEPWENRSNTKQDAFNKEANRRAEVFLKEELLPLLRGDFSEILDAEPEFYIDESDLQTICFNYPCCFIDGSILRSIRLEIGALAAWTPSVTKVMSPYAAMIYPDVFSKKETEILTVSAKRTFWEKVTILHHEANRREGLAMPARYSRHYYDLYCIANSPVKDEALCDLSLLSKVVGFKMKFYPQRWAKYEEAVPGTLRLVPPEYRFDELRRDYAGMREMMFGEYPEFDSMMDCIKQLEEEINRK